MLYRVYGLVVEEMDVDGMEMSRDGAMAVLVQSVRLFQVKSER